MLFPHIFPISSEFCHIFGPPLDHLQLHGTCQTHPVVDFQEEHIMVYFRILGPINIQNHTNNDQMMMMWGCFFKFCTLGRRRMTNFGGFRAPIMQQRLTTVLGRASTEKNDVLPTVETSHKSRAFRSYLLHSLTIWVLLNIIFIHVPRNIGSFEIYQPIRRGRKIFIGAGLPCWLHTAPKDRSSLSRSLGKENSKTSYILRTFS